MIFFTGCPRQLMMRCPLTLAHDLALENDGHVAFVPALCSFIFIGDHYSLEDQDAVIALVTCSLQVTTVDYGAAASTDLQVTNLVELQGESTSVSVKTFLVKREC
jgi:hypothetical protein